MKKRPFFEKRLGNKGQALVLSYMVIATLIVFSAMLMTKAISEKNTADRNQLKTQAFYMAEGANENAIAAFTFAIANYQVPTSITTFTNTTTFATFNNATVNTTITRLEANDRLLTEGGANASINVYECNYEVMSTAVHPQNNTIAVTVHQIIARRLIPTFQHAVFYNMDLEVLPGADMTLSGRIHSNQDIYFGGSGSSTDLKIDTTYVHTAGDIYNDRKDTSGKDNAADVSIRINTKDGSTQFASMDGLDSSDPNWIADSSRWADLTTPLDGTVQTAAQGVTKLTAPSVGTTQPGGYYNSNAGLVISADSAGNVSVVQKKADGTTKTLVKNTDYDSSAITPTTGLQNLREGKSINMVSVNLKKLAGGSGTTCGGSSCPNTLPYNGLIYTTNSNTGGGREPGIELTTDKNLIARNGGLTVVSNDPVYLLGDYNYNPSNPSATPQPAAIIADAVNLLSNAWNDGNSGASGWSNRNATETTYNTAFVAGNNNTAGSQYSGGLENYPRLLENWSNIYMHITGSFVALWNSVIGTGAWPGTGSPYYNAPKRDWHYNTNFNNVNNLPPFTPMAVETQRVAWWSE